MSCQKNHGLLVKSREIPMFLNSNIHSTNSFLHDILVSLHSTTIFLNDIPVFFSTVCCFTHPLGSKSVPFPSRPSGPSGPPRGLPDVQRGGRASVQHLLFGAGRELDALPGGRTARKMWAQKMTDIRYQIPVGIHINIYITKLTRLMGFMGGLSGIDWGFNGI